jgi:hypothetical protein
MTSIFPASGPLPPRETPDTAPTGGPQAPRSDDALPAPRDGSVTGGGDAGADAIVAHAHYPADGGSPGVAAVMGYLSQ